MSALILAAGPEARSTTLKLEMVEATETGLVTAH
jgi:hypothetical protein